MTTTMQKIGPLAVVALASTLLLVGCAPDPLFDSPGSTSQEGSQDNTSTEGEPSTPVEPATPAVPEPEAQAESCDWDSPRLSSSGADAPHGQSGDLKAALIGAWQHTHIKDGADYEAVKPGTDIRYVFPSATRMLYCQDVAGATSQAENAVDLQIEGTKLVLGSSGVSYGVVAWSADTMVWKNHRDGSLYLLKRR